MKEIVVSLCEKKFVQTSIAEGFRLDGRNLDESRNLKLCYGADWGSCHVSLGNTKVVAHVTCKVGVPKQTRPNEGLLFVNLELGTMGAPNFDANRQSDLNVYLNRLIEKCLKESKCVDLESLCIVSEEKVWALRVDIHVLNHAGNLIECASVAALASLAHFKIPDVTTSGEEITIHTLAEKDPIPVVLHHYPVCVSFGIFADGTMVSDPSLIEETVCGVSGALLVVGMNPYREICLLDLAGAAVTSGPNLILKATQKAVNRVQYLVSTIKAGLTEDEKLRAARENTGFARAISKDQLLTMAVDKLCLRLKKFDLTMSQDYKDEQDQPLETSGENTEMMVSNDEVAPLIPKTTNDSASQGIWPQMGSDDSSDDEKPADSMDVEITQVITPDDRIVAKIDVSSESEEENVVVLQKGVVKAKRRNRPKKKKNKKNKSEV